MNNKLNKMNNPFIIKGEQEDVTKSTLARDAVIKGYMAGKSFEEI